MDFTLILYFKLLFIISNLNEMYISSILLFTLEEKDVFFTILYD
jgi:hypothetical protein